MVAAAVRAPAAVLEAEGLVVGYGPSVVLEAVSLHVRASELVAVVGDNGAGKTTLVRTLAGELKPRAGTIRPSAADVGVVWQDLALVEDLGVAENLLLGREGGVFVSPRRTHAEARAMLRDLGLSLGDLARPLRTLSGGQRRLVAIARELARQPRFLLLDEPTSSLGAAEATAVVRLVRDACGRGVGVLLVSHDLDLVTQIADRIVVLRRGRVVADVPGGSVGPDDLGELILGDHPQQSSRRQLERIVWLAREVAEGGAESGVAAITATCSAALGGCGVATVLLDAAGRGVLESAVGVDAATADAVLEELEAPTGLLRRALEFGAAHGLLEVRNVQWELWGFAIRGPSGPLGVLVIGRDPTRDRARPRLELAPLYAAQVATVVERERALLTLAHRNHVLEVLRGALEILARGADVERALEAALASFRQAIGASVLELLEGDAAGSILEQSAVPTGEWVRKVPASSLAVLRAVVPETAQRDDTEELLNAALSVVRLALERRELERVAQEAAALRRSQALQVAFVHRLSHELRTPLTAITGYASSLLANDVAWDAASQHRFLTRIVSESQRLARLVGDLLDLSAIESGTLRLRRDWAELAYVVEAAVACVPEVTVDVDVPEGVPPVFVDHDRLEQVLVNLLHNAAYHNPPGTHIRLRVRHEPGRVVVAVEDDGPAIPHGVSLAELAERGRREGGNGLGLAISLSIVEALGGSLTLVPRADGKCFEVVLPEVTESAGDVVVVAEGQ